jgi:uncharacterized RDD family membrane protein YckC
MGYSVWWLGVSGKERGQVLDELGLALDGEAEDVIGHPLVGVTLPTGWFLVLLNRYAPVWYTDEELADLSAGCSVISCEAEEHAMYSAASGFADGRRSWRIVHDDLKDPDDLRAEGDLPPDFSAIFASLKEKHDLETAEWPGGDAPRTDYLFDVPVDVAQALSGFRHDYDPPEGSEIHVLAAAVKGPVKEVPAGVRQPPAADDYPGPPLPPGQDGAPRSRTRYGATPPRTDPAPPAEPGDDAKVQDRAWGIVLDGLVAAFLGAVSLLLVLALSIFWAGALAGVAYLAPLVLVGGYMLLRDAGGQSRGKRACELRVVTLDGRPITAAQSVRRNLTLAGAVSAAWLLLPVPVIGPFLWSVAKIAQLALIAYEIYLVASRRRRLGDRLAGTRVVLHPNPIRPD